MASGSLGYPMKQCASDRLWGARKGCQQWLQLQKQHDCLAEMKVSPWQPCCLWPVCFCRKQRYARCEMKRTGPPSHDVTQLCTNPLLPPFASLSVVAGAVWPNGMLLLQRVYSFRELCRMLFHVTLSLLLSQQCCAFDHVSVGFLLLLSSEGP